MATGIPLVSLRTKRGILPENAVFRPNGEDLCGADRCHNVEFSFAKAFSPLFVPNPFLFPVQWLQSPEMKNLILSQVGWIF